MEQFNAILEKVGSMTDEANVDLTFGKPEEFGERILIPVAEVAYGFGIGAGSAEPGAEGTPESDAGAGVGGGGGAKARPLAYIEVGPDGVHVESIIDEQKIALAGIALVAWSVGWIGLVLKKLLKH